MNNPNRNKYSQYTDFIFKKTVQKYANGVLKFLDIPYEIENIILSEIADAGPKIHRLDFAGIVKKGSEEICLILECQKKLPTEDDITRFFQYVSSLRVLKNRKVELYILCITKAAYEKKEYVLNDGCTYVMHVISLKKFKAMEIFKRIENKIENNEEIADEDIACLQLIAYTDYTESTYDILKKAYEIVEKLNIDINEKEAISYILNILSTNMLDDMEKNRLMEENNMMINPRDEYFLNKGKLEIAIKLINDGMPIKKVMELTGLTEKQILNAK